MPPTKPPYPPEFRREAVQLTRTSERSIAQLAPLGPRGPRFALAEAVAFPAPELLEAA